MPKTYTVKDVASILGFSTNSIYAFLKAKRIKGVRVGKGRFRIPEEELSRILHLSKKTVTEEPLPPVNTSILSIDQKEPVFYEHKKSIDTMDADIFDWFVGTASLVSGLALFLFNAASQVNVLPTLLPVLRVVFMVSGIGLILSSFQGLSKRWHVFFHVLVGVTSGIGAYGLARDFDITGAVLYAALSVVILLNITRKETIAVSMGYFVTFLAFGSVLGIIIWPEQAMIKTLIAYFGRSQEFVQWVCLGLTVVNISLYWIGYLKQYRRLFTAICVISGVAFVITAGIYGVFLYWSRAFFFVVLAFYIIFLPISLLLEQSTSEKQRLYLHIFFGGIVGFLIFAIIMIFSLHNVLWQDRVQDFENKILSGKTVVENAFSSVKASVLTASGNADFVKAVKNRDTETLIKNVKVVYEGNPMIRRLILLNAVGDVVTVYPYSVLEQQNFAFREYFTKVRDTKSLYVSNVFDTNSSEGKRSVVSVVVPFLDEKRVFQGVMVASVNLEKIALQLNKMSSESDKETFFIVDNSGRYIVHANTAMIGSALYESDLLRKAVLNQKGIENGLLADGSIGLVAYDTMPSVGWGISVVVPSASVLSLGEYTVLMIFGTLFFIFILAIGLLYVMKFWWLPQVRGSS